MGKALAAYLDSFHAKLLVQTTLGVLELCQADKLKKYIYNDA